MLGNNKIYKHLFSLLIALNVGLAIYAAIQQKWWSVAGLLGSAMLLIAIVLVVKEGKVNKLSAALFTVTAVENGLEVAKQFLSHDYAGSLWDIASIVICVYWMRQYYVEEEQHD
ncbi:permease [Bacillus cereus]|uniref:permease n=1 Tax=Bacillus cereus group TaxID=86661 RepID=UPI001D0ECA02|nr:permease [Bacillus cereus]MCC2370459.1 permease [Bacillus cereus]MCC2450164.1 permease [Bacillus cereus]MCC2491182.1 permease [Bacillus cereus]MCU5627945.1 permease [Bacillus cereus]MDF9552225.1 permease [Bacillus cereus]